MTSNKNIFKLFIKNPSNGSKMIINYINYATQEEILQNITFYYQTIESFDSDYYIDKSTSQLFFMYKNKLHLY